MSMMWFATRIGSRLFEIGGPARLSRAGAPWSRGLLFQQNRAGACWERKWNYTDNYALRQLTTGSHQPLARPPTKTGFRSWLRN